MSSGPAVVDAAGNQLETRSVSSFELQPDEGRVAVSVNLSILNEGAGRDGAKGKDQSVPIVIQKGASDVQVSGKGTQISLAEKGDFLDTYEVTFPRIGKNKTRKLQISYDLVAGGPDSPRATRVNEAYAHFCWHGLPTDRTTVKATLPEGYEPQTLPEGVVVKANEERTTLKPSGRKYARWLQCVESSNPSQLIEETVTSDSGEAVVIEGWPEDPEWVDAVAFQVRTALPALTSWVDLPLPAEEITVRQSATQALPGYDGSFDRHNALIRVGETAERSTVITHELAHAWFNESTMGEMWMIEGGAEWAAKLTHGFECQDPSTFDLPGGAKLRDWQMAETAAGRSDGDRVAYQYAASCWIHQEITEAMGVEHMSDVNHALLEGLPKYAGNPDPAVANPDWREWLDAVDEVGLVPAGTTDLEFAERLLLEFGVALPRELDGRSEARALYHAVLDAWGDDTPVVVSRSMDRWAFEDATKAIDITNAIMRELAGAEAGSSDVETLTADVAAAETLAELRSLHERAAALA